MKFVALVSGGKDSCFNIMHCLAQGHELACLANLYPPTQNSDEIDSYMFQTVGHDVLSLYDKCIGVPMYREPILGKAENQKLEYDKTIKDETEDLFRLLSKVKENHPDVEGVSVGAILSNYQRTRVENVCSRLGLTSLAYLWERNQAELMDEMCLSHMDARIVKVAAIGLDDSHLGKTLQEIHPTLVKLNEQFEVHICGEGGEFETIVLDAPFFKFGKIEIVDRKVIKHLNDDVWYLKMNVKFQPKANVEEVKDWKKFVVEPPLLNEMFQDVYDFVNEIKTVSHNLDQNSMSKCNYENPKMNISQDLDRLYISNIVSNEDTVEKQIIGIFENLKKVIEDNNLTFEHVQSSKLFIKNMSNFAKINKIYNGYFTKPLPPSRICVETTLINDAQLSVVVMKDLKQKGGLHIQGRSYWAPCNIGPYSQAVFSKDNERETIMRISGQIPLVPKNMELNNTEDFKLQCVLSLQHYDKIKKTCNYNNNLLTVCYIKDCQNVKTVSNTFKEYQSINEDFDNGNKNLIILRVTELPKGSDCEWGGLAYKEIVNLGYESTDDEDDSMDIKDKYKLTFVYDSMNKICSPITETGRELYGDIEALGLCELSGERNPVVQVYDSNGDPAKLAVFGKCV